MASDGVGQATKFFGVDLDTAIKSQQAKGFKKEIPRVVTETTAWLLSHNLEKDIFDTLGEADTVKDIKDKYDAGDITLSSYGDEHQHNILAILKLYLRELPEPIPSRYYSTFLRLMGNPEVAHKVYLLRVLIYMLPKTSRELVLHLLGFMYTISQREKEITSAILASVFGPYLFRPDAEGSNQVEADIPAVLALMQCLIEEAPFIGKNTPKPSAVTPTAPTTVSANPQHSLQAKALYPYAGGSKWLLAFEKDRELSILDIKSEDGWLKGDMDGTIGYLPTTYVAPILSSPPASSVPRVPIPPEVATAEEVAAMNEMQLPPPPPLDLPPPPSIDIALPPLPTDIPPLSSLPPPPIELPLPDPIFEQPRTIRRAPSKTMSMYMGNAQLPRAFSPPMSSPVGSPMGSPFNSPYMPPSVSAHLDVDGGTINQMTTSSGPVDKSNRAQYATIRVPTTKPGSTSTPAFQIPFKLPTPVATNTGITPLDDANTTIPVPPSELPLPPPMPTTDLASMPQVVDEAKEAQIKGKRRERADEVLSTERTYVKQLTAVYELFLEPLKRREKEKNPIINSTDIYDIFSNIEVIWSCHKKLLEALEQRMQSWDSKPELGDIFLENTAFIKLYKYYVNNFDKSIITLKACKEKSPEFKKFLSELDYSEKLSGLNLEAFVILPVQRIPRYVLLLTDLLKYTQPTHMDFNNLSNALAFIKELADYINTNKSDADNINKILTVAEGILDIPADQPLVVPRRKFITDCPFVMNKKKVHLFLFSDALLITKPEKKGKRYKTLVNLQTASLNTTDEPNVLKMISTEGTFKFTTENAKDKEFWAKTLKDTINFSRTDMLTSAFGANMQNEGSKKFMKIQDEENVQKRHAIVVRTLKSEEEYIKSIKYIQEKFFAPMRKSVDSAMPMISLSDMIEITSNLETLEKCHEQFQKSIQERLNEWNEKPFISDLFTEKAKFLKLYNYYVENHHKSLETIDKCISKSPLFAIFLRNLEAQEKVEFKHLLQEPLRRVSAYYLVVQEMLQFTRPKTDDYDDLAKVVAQLKAQTDTLDAGIHSKLNPDKSKDKRKSQGSKLRFSNNK